LDFQPNQSFAFVFYDEGYVYRIDDDDDYEMIVLAYLPHSPYLPVFASPSKGQRQVATLGK
jgi:hypothetical protein